MTSISEILNYMAMLRHWLKQINIDTLILE
jgi:hypothetical protein